MGKLLDFRYAWDGPADGQVREVDYEINLQEEFLFDYGVVPTMEEMEAKPNAIPFYQYLNKPRKYSSLLKVGKRCASTSSMPAGKPTS